MTTKRVGGFSFIGQTEGVCGGEPIIGTRLQPKQIVQYGTKEEAMLDFDLSREQVEECYLFMGL